VAANRAASCSAALVTDVPSLVGSSEQTTTGASRSSYGSQTHTTPSATRGGVNIVGGQVHGDMIPATLRFPATVLPCRLDRGPTWSRPLFIFAKKAPKRDSSFPHRPV